MIIYGPIKKRRQKRMSKKSLFFLLILLLLLSAFSASAATLNGKVFHDKTMDGKMEGEKGLRNVSLVLESKEGVTKEIDVSPNGDFYCEGIVAGDYRIIATLPNGYVSTLYGFDSLLYPSIGETAQTDWFFIGDTKEVFLGATKSSVYFNFVVFEDENSNGGRMLSEPGIKNVQIDIHANINGEDMVVYSGVTNKDGTLIVRDFSPYTYTVSATLPENYIIGPKGKKQTIFYNCFNTSDTNIAYSDAVDLFSGSVGMGIGAVKTGAAEGKIWYDQNSNGKMDADEKGYLKATIDLKLQGTDLTRTTTVQEDGSFAFTALQPGTYDFTVTLPETHMFTLPNGDSQFTNGYAFSQSGTVIVTALSTATIQPVGVMDATSLLVSFYQDLDFDGIRQENEPSYLNATVELYVNDKKVLESKTDANGDAFFPVVRGGDVTITATLHDESVFSNIGTGNDFTSIGAKNQASIDVTLAHATLNTKNAGITKPASITGVCYADENNNGLLDKNEKGIQNFTVQAIDIHGNVVHQTVSDEQGAFTLYPLLPDAHTVRVLLSDPYISSPYVEGDQQNKNDIVTQNASYGETNIFALYPDTTLDHVAIGIFKAATLNGVVLQNKNHDDLTTNEGGMEGVLVTLLHADGSQYSDIAVDTTKEDGSFYIKGILPGEYMLQYKAQNGILFTSTDDDTILSQVFSCSMGSQTELPPVGAVRSASISGSAQSMNGNKGDVTISITGQNHGSERILTTNSDGTFSINGLRPDDYDIMITLPTNTVFSKDHQMLVPKNNTDVSTAVLSLAPAQILNEQIISYTTPAQITGLCFYDENYSKVYENGEGIIPNQAFDILDKEGNVVQTVTAGADGKFLSVNLIPDSYTISLSLSNQILVAPTALQNESVWSLPIELHDGETKTQDVGILKYAIITGSLWNLDGSKDMLHQREVSLYKENEPVAIKTTQTNTDGGFLFKEVLPGNYTIQVSIPDNALFARTVDTGEKQSIVLADTEEGKNASSALFPVLMGEVKAKMDVGIGATGAVGDFAFLDENKNGLQDIGEKGIPKLTISFYQYGVLAHQTETNAYGHYYLDKMYPGTYEVKVTMHDTLSITKKNNDFPLVSSVLDSEEGQIATAHEVVVPSNGQNLAVDFGFVLKNDNVYPPEMDNMPTTDWSYNGTKTYE